MISVVAFGNAKRCPRPGAFLDLGLGQSSAQVSDALPSWFSLGCSGCLDVGISRKRMGAEFAPGRRRTEGITEVSGVLRRALFSQHQGGP